MEHTYERRWDQMDDVEKDTYRRFSGHPAKAHQRCMLTNMPLIDALEVLEEYRAAYNQIRKPALEIQGYHLIGVTYMDACIDSGLANRKLLSRYAVEWIEQLSDELFGRGEFHARAF